MQLTALAIALDTSCQWATPGACDSFLSAFRGFSRLAAPIAVTAIWQGAVIAGGLALCLRLAPRTSAGHRFAVWAAAFATLVSLSLLELVSGFSSAAVAAVSPATPEAAARPWLSIDARWSLLIAALWAAAALLRAMDLAIHSFRLRVLWKHAVPVDLDSGVFSMAARVAARRCGESVQVCTTTTLQRPSVIGFFKPRILIPDWLFARLTPGELEQIVLHEAEHLCRRDDWTNLIQKLCLVLFPLNPALVWMERCLCREREMACDEGVIRITRAPRAYAACLASLAERGLQHRAEALSLGAWQRRSELVHRVHSILRGKHTLGPLGARALLGALGCGLLFSSVELIRCPQLIAFVPAQNHERNEYAANAMTPGRLQAASAHVLDAAYVPPRSAVARHDFSGVKATKMEAVPPAILDSQFADGRVSMQHNVAKQNVALARETGSDKSNLHLPQPVLLKAEMPNLNPAQAHEQQWIVLTAWEQFQSSSLATGFTADYETDASTGAARGIDIHADPQPVNQITVTQLILRIVPASSFATHSAAVPSRGGWLVIQL